MAEPEWLKLQKKIFTRYVQQTLKLNGSTTTVSDLLPDLSDGVLLIELLELLSGKKFTGKRPQKSKIRMQQIDNCNQALKFGTETCGIKTQASAEQVVDSNKPENAKLLLGTIFQMILKYLKIEDDDGNPAADVKKALNLWLQNRVAGYPVKVENFTSSFHDGRVFAAMIHKVRPKVIDFQSMGTTTEIQNLKTVLDVAEKFCHVEKYLTAEDIAKLDEVSMIVYLTDWYSGLALLQKQDIAAKRIGKLIVMTQLHDKMRADYKAGATAFNQWVDAKIASLNDRAFEGTLAAIQARLEQFYAYKNQEKLEKLGQEMDLDSLFNDLALRLKNAQRPAFNPGNELIPSGLEKKIELLEQAEAEASAALHAELKRQLKLHSTAKRFRVNVADSTEYVNHKKSYFDKAETIASLDEAERAQTLCGIEELEVKQAQQRLTAYKETFANLESEKFEDLADIKSLLDGIVALFDATLSAAASKKTTLEGELQKQLTINDDTCKAFAAEVKSFSEWIGIKKEALKSKENEALKAQLDALNASAADHSQAEGMLQKIEAAEGKVKEREVVDNPHTNLSLADCKSMWVMFGMQFKKRLSLLSTQLAEQESGGLTTEQVQEIKDNFAYFDSNKTNQLDKRELRVCLQSLGEDFTPKAVEKLLGEYDTDKTGTLNYSEFEKYMATKLGDTNSKDEIIQSFKYCCYDAEFVTVQNLDVLVNELSWKTSHVDYLKQEMKPLGDGMDYPKWTQEVFDR